MKCVARNTFFKRERKKYVCVPVTLHGLLRRLIISAQLPIKLQGADIFLLSLGTRALFITKQTLI